MDVNEISIFVSSSDAYSDIWSAFFALLKREWPDYRGRIYLNTETLGFNYEGLDIVCTKLGKQSHFGDFFLRGIERIDGDRFLLLMIDYFIEGRVDIARLQEICDLFMHDEADTFTLTTQPYGFHPLPSRPSFSRLDPCEAWRIMFSFQAAFWKKDSLRRIIYRHEDPWRAEHLGSRRAALENMKFYVLSNREGKPIRYDESGVLHGGGKWLMSALSHIDLAGIPLDIGKSHRPIYRETASPALGFIKGEIKATPMKIRSWLTMIAKHPRAVKMLAADIVGRFKTLAVVIVRAFRRTGSG